jgi:hypothetical protein
MLTRRGMLRHIGAAGAAAATPRGGKRGTQRREVRPAARRLRLPCARVRRPCGVSLPAGRAHTRRGLISWHSPGQHWAVNFCLPRSKRSLGRLFALLPPSPPLRSSVAISPRPMFRSRWGWRVKRVDLIMHIRPYNLSGAISRTPTDTRQKRGFTPIGPRGCKHIPEKQFFVSLNRSALCPATFGPTISG